VSGGGAAAVELLDVLAAHGLTVSTAESLTGGLLAASLTDPPGSSRAFLGAVVAYATAAKSSVLGVPAPLLAEHGPVAAPTAAAMARHARLRFAATLGIATTGVAGPDPVDGLPPGLVFVATDLAGGPALGQRLMLPGNRAGVRAQTVEAALALALRTVGTRFPDRGMPPSQAVLDPAPPQVEPS
jgi:nicotinamide-nucleotide amidase